jgi:hypothetical protein
MHGESPTINGHQAEPASMDFWTVERLQNLISALAHGFNRRQLTTALPTQPFFTSVTAIRFRRTDRGTLAR